MSASRKTTNPSNPNPNTEQGAGTDPAKAANTPPPADPPADSPTPAADGTDVTTPPSGPKADDARPGTAAAVGGPNTKMIDALLDEREGYERAGNTERVKAVDKALASYGTTPAKAKRDREQRARDNAGGVAQRAANDANQKMIDALLDEREGYVRVDKSDRVAQVDEQLQALGTTHAQAAKEREARLQDRTATPDGQRAGGQQTR